MAVRQTIRGLEQNESRFELYRAAFETFASRGDDRGYTWFASLHGLPLPVWCEHARGTGTEDMSLLFLPWHRAYLYYYELGLQGRLGQRLSVVQEATDDDVGLPWWDWTSDESRQDGLPTSYLAAPFADAAIPVGPTTTWTGVWSDPLLEWVRERVGHSVSKDDPPRTVREPQAAADLPRWLAELDDPEDDVVSILAASTFEDFSSRLEMGPHNAVHQWVGGSMSVVLTAAFDPIFWSHHCMIDRLWYLWQNSERGEDPPTSILDTVLSPFPMTVADTLDIGRLGYEYAVQMT